MGIAGDFVANFTSSRVERDQVGTFAGRENRVIPARSSSSFFGQVDPYARATVILEAAEEFEGGERALAFGLARGLPGADRACRGASGPRAGASRLRLGLLNELQLHDRPPPDSPRTC